ncbi:MAG: UDP-N-acetylmuramoyl-tripeptide--D-alanyl-D-alanine ligase [Candidatus Omnitrophota bacterium]|nr:MAG: UDP-N-acetylmuramoyl-tripeptide--D-alanyl-D-alanine ligase [Candidatus Omnitrophota bacterium]
MKEPLIKSCKTLEKLINSLKVINQGRFRPIGGFSIDSRSLKKGDCFIALYGRHHDGHNFISQAITNGASCVISQKNIQSVSKVPVFVVKDSYAPLEELVRYIREIKNPFVFAITGSVGKTTTKEMLSFILEGRFKVLKNEKTENNILGVAKTILSLTDQEMLVLELGTNAPGEIERLARMCMPDVGIITFIKAVHLEGLKSLKGIRKEKTALLKSNPRMRAVLNGDDPLLGGLNSNKRTYWFGRAKTNNLWAQILKLGQRSCEFTVKNKFRLTLGVPFEGFIYNALAAMQGAQLANIPLKDSLARMNRFKGFPALRMEFKENKGYAVLNDAYNANPYSLKEALNTVKRYPQKKIAVIADMLELGKKSAYYHQSLASPILRCKFEYVLTLGDYTFYLDKRLKELGCNNAFHFSSQKELAQFIKDKFSETKLNENQEQKGWLIFLKGSRKMELEKITEYLG